MLVTTLSLLATLSLPPIALDGEAASGNNAALGIVSVLSIVVAYLLLGALWYFVFRPKARQRRGRRPPE